MYSKLQKVKCPKCGGKKESYSYLAKKITTCTLCKGEGKVEVMCAIKDSRYEL